MLAISPEKYLYLNRYVNNNNTGYTFTLEEIKGHELVTKLSATHINWVADSNKWLVRNWVKRELLDDGELITNGDSLMMDLVIHPKDFQ